MTTPILTALAAVVGIAAGYLAAWLRLHRRTAQAVEQATAYAAALRAQVGELLAALHAMPPGPHRTSVAQFRAKTVERLDETYLHDRDLSQAA